MPFSSSDGGSLGSLREGMNGWMANGTREGLSAAPWGGPPSPLSLPYKSLSSAGPAPTPPVQPDRLRAGWLGTGGGTHAHNRTHLHTHSQSHTTTHIYTHTMGATNSHATHTSMSTYSHIHTQLQAELLLLTFPSVHYLPDA